MKKLLLLSLISVMAFAFTGCVNNDEEAELMPAEELSRAISIDTSNHFPLISFKTLSTDPYLVFNLISTRNLVVTTQNYKGEYLEVFYLTIPYPNISVAHTFRFSHEFDFGAERTVTISEVIDPNKDYPTESHALRLFDLLAKSSKHINVSNVNKAIEYIRIRGGRYFYPQTFNFIGFESLRELYLVETCNSQAYIQDCPALQYFSTSGSFYKPEGVSTNLFDNMIEPPLFIIIESITEPDQRWPKVPEQTYSLCDHSVFVFKALTIVNCPNIKALSLENTRISEINFSGLNNLSYLYLSSAHNYIIDAPYPGDYYNRSGRNLANAIYSLRSMVNLRSGNIILRGIEGEYPSTFAPIKIGQENYNSIVSSAQSLNWSITWDSGYQIAWYLMPDPIFPWKPIL